MFLVHEPFTSLLVLIDDGLKAEVDLRVALEQWKQHLEGLRGEELRHFPHKFQALPQEALPFGLILSKIWKIHIMYHIGSKLWEQWC